jgi:hypothetical protein
MQAETEKLLATLETISQRDRGYTDGGYTGISWNTNSQGEFNLWNLLNSEGHLHETDLNLVFEHWQNMESWGTPTDMRINNYEYAPPRSQREHNDWNEEIAAERSSVYQQLKKFLTSNCIDIQAYTITHKEYYPEEWCRPNFYVSFAIAKTITNEWLCLMPTVPYQMKLYTSMEHSGLEGVGEDLVISNKTDTSLFISNELTVILNQLKRLEMYGYFQCDDYYTYFHQIYHGISSTKEDAITMALQSANMVKITHPSQYRKNYYNSELIQQFMNECLQNRIRYRVNFWDLVYIYEMGKIPDDDWIGLCSHVEHDNME